MKKIILATVLVGLSSTAALAADLYTKAPPPIAAPIPTWAGFYIGGNIGYGWGDGTTQTDVVITATPIDPTFDTNPEGVIGGVQIGYNWQTGSIVVGLEADIQGSGIEGSETISLNGTAFQTSDHELSWFGTVRGRLGFAATPTMLLYATGGLAYGQVEASATTVVGATQLITSVSETSVGWTVGAGGEWMFAPNWSTKLEYLYVDLDSVSVAGATTNLTTDTAWDNQYHIIRAGVNYRF